MSKVPKEKFKYCIEYTDDKGLFKYKICKTLLPEVKECDIYHKKMIELLIDRKSYASMCVPNRLK